MNLFEMDKHVQRQDKLSKRKGKTRTAAYHFSLGRQCSRCSTTITNYNKSGLCWKCYCLAKRFNVQFPNKAHGQTEEHRQLKDSAMKWLVSAGCSDVKDETSIRLAKNKRIILDATGRKDGEIWVVECGGSSRKKLDQVLSITSHLFIWPYNHNRPYLFTPDIVVCSSCGHFKRKQIPT